MLDQPASLMPSRSTDDPLFAGPGEMRALCREFDWSATPLGPTGRWPASLRATVGILLGSRNPMFLFWGPDLIQIYNDAYRPSLGAAGRADSRHPHALGMRGREFWTEIWDTIGPQIEQVMTTGEATWHEDQYLPIERNGRLDDVWWTYSYGPVPDDAGGVGGVLVVCQETTQRVLAEQALRESEARLRATYAESEKARAIAESANQVKAQFLTMMSHELRTPLNAIGGYTELLQLSIEGELTERQRQFLDRIEHSQRHLLGLINEVLSFAKLETGSVSYDIRDVLVGNVLESAEALVEPQARVAEIDIVIDTGPAGLTARADEERICQILVNLMSNAVKFTDMGGRVDVMATRADDDVIIDVRDTGIGIPEDQIEAIFDPFVQVRSDLARPYEGTGLGLAISRDLARGMGGELRVESTSDAGSTFRLRLPSV